MQALLHSDFRDILTAVYNGNRSAAEQTAENTIAVNEKYIANEYDRMKQYRLKFKLGISNRRRI